MTRRSNVAEVMHADSAAIEARRKFAVEQLVTKDGAPFALPPERQWVLDEYWGAADAFKLWPADMDALCDECKVESGELVYQWVPAHRSQRPAHRATGCAGLELQPIIVTLLNLPRQEGKTTNGMGYDLSTIFLQRNKHVMFVAASEKQTHRLFDENYRNAIERNPKLRKRCEIVGDTIYVPSTNSRFTMVATSANSAVGSSPTHVRYDEAAKIPADVFMALVPSIFARNGWECPIPGHYHVSGTSGRKTCPKCGTRLVPWYGRLIITSSSRVDDSAGERAWFDELVEQLTHTPDANFHLYKRDDSLNPAINSTVKAAMARVLGKLESTREYVEAEVHNRAVRLGGDVVSTAQLDAVMSSAVGATLTSDRAAVAFLDTSISGDKTSLVITLDDAREGEDMWHRMIAAAHLRVWDPATSPQGVIDAAEIERHLRAVVPMFPRLTRIVIDDHFMPWAIAMIRALRQSVPWARKLESANAWKGGESQIGWGLLEEKVACGLIALPNDERIRREFRGVTKRRKPDGSVEYVDRNRKVSHRDITEAIACSCYLAHTEGLRRRLGLTESERPRSREMIERLPRPVVRLRAEDL